MTIVANVLFLNNLHRTSENYVFGYSSLIIDGRMIIDVLGKCAWHSGLHSDVVFAFFIHNPNV